MLSNEDIKGIIDDCAERGMVVSTRDIAYAILRSKMEDGMTAYKCVFGADMADPDIQESYDESNTISYLRDYVPYVLDRTERRAGVRADITFDENKAYMLRLKADTEAAMSAGEIDKKDGLMILKDIAVKLNDKFNISDTSTGNTIIVNKKFNSICPKCGSELYIPSKRDLMEKYNLIERK